MYAKVEHLVVDTSAFIKNTSLQDVGEHIYTVQEVVDEITNKRQLRRLVVLPYNLHLKDVFPENVTFITEYSKKTGDYPSLSSADIKVMALTYQLEKEKVSTDHLKLEPQVNKVMDFSRCSSHVPTATVGFYAPSSKSSGLSPESVNTETDIDEKLQEKFASLDCSETGENDINVEQILVPVKEGHDDHNEETSESVGDDNTTEEESSDDDDDDDDDAGWITPENIDHVKQQMYSEEDNDKSCIVACITSDFAMQNVLKHLGLNVISVDGQKIKHLRTFILRCYACFKTTSIMTKVFCPNCGNKTLKKVAVSVKEDGTLHIHINARKPLTPRGKKFSLPRPQGGKHASNPILCEDQRIPHQLPSRLARIKNNPLDPDYIAGFSPFVTRDVTSRSAMLGIRAQSTDVKNWMRKNPNEVVRKGNRKRK